MIGKHISDALKGEMGYEAVVTNFATTAQHESNCRKICDSSKYTESPG